VLLPQKQRLMLSAPPRSVLLPQKQRLMLSAPPRSVLLPQKQRLMLSAPPQREPPLSAPPPNVPLRKRLPGCALPRSARLQSALHMRLRRLLLSALPLSSVKLKCAQRLSALLQ
jgi:hypothetical protein